MKIKKVVLTAVAALALFATSAVATSSVNPVVSNASTHKVHKHVKNNKHSIKYPWLLKVKSKGHATHYYLATKKTKKMTLHYARNVGWRYYIPDKKALPGYKIVGHYLRYFVSSHSKRVHLLIPTVLSFVNKKHAPINDKTFKIYGAHRVSKSRFNHLFNKLIQF